MGFVGVGGQGSGDMGGFMGFPEVQVLAVCDVDTRHRERAQQQVENRYAQDKASGAYKGCAAYNDYRELCARPDIDAVFCGTPDHWHALVTCEAMRNGKDVYCEKPETLTVREGPNHGRDGAPLRPRLFRRQPAGLGRLQLVPPHDVVRHVRRVAGGLGEHRRAVQRDAVAGRTGARVDGLGPAGWVRPRGGPTTRAIIHSRGAAAATSPAAA